MWSIYVPQALRVPACLKICVEKLLLWLRHELYTAEKQKVAVIVDQVSKKAAEIGAVKDDAEKDLSAAKPALDEALSALNSITPKDIVALKALKSPPDIVKRIFDAVLLLRYWPIDKVRDTSCIFWQFCMIIYPKP